MASAREATGHDHRCGRWWPALPRQRGIIVRPSRRWRTPNPPAQSGCSGHRGSRIGLEMRLVEPWACRGLHPEMFSGVASSAKPGASSRTGHAQRQLDGHQCIQIAGQDGGRRRGSASGTSLTSSNHRECAPHPGAGLFWQAAPGDSRTSARPWRPEARWPMGLRTLGPMSSILGQTLQNKPQQHGNYAQQNNIDPHHYIDPPMVRSYDNPSRCFFVQLEVNCCFFSLVKSLISPIDIPPIEQYKQPQAAHQSVSNPPHACRCRDGDRQVHEPQEPIKFPHEVSRGSRIDS